MIMTKLAILAGPFTLFALLGACTLKIGTGDEPDAGPSGPSTTGAGGTSASGGSTGGSAVAGSSGSAGGGGSTPGTTTMADAGTSSDESCTDGNEAVPNDDREHAIKVAVNAPVKGCLQSLTDVDFYEFTAPAAPAQGGYVQVQVTDVGSTANGLMRLYAASDNGQFVETHASAAGAEMLAWFAAQPGATFRVAVTNYNDVRMPTPYVITAKFTGVPDANEPNDDLGHATPITTNADVSGYFFAGLVASTVPLHPATYDFYKVTLTTAPVTITLRPPGEANSIIELRNEAGTLLTDHYEFASGSSSVITYTPPTAGTYYVVAYAYSALTYFGTGSTVPTYYTAPYKLTVAQ